jgi:transcriptional regulator with XRE-family HTH domain
MKNLGQQIRMIRQKKGIGLNSFAQQIGVSSGYLSNLETGKTDNIQLTLLDRLQQELHLIPTPQDNNQDELFLRVQRIYQLLQQMESTYPEVVEHLLHTVEQGINLWMEHDNSSSNPNMPQKLDIIHNKK